MEGKPKVGILTTFGNFDTSYSLVSVVRDQLIAHVAHGYEPVLFVLKGFDGDVPEGVTVRPIVPRLYLEAYQGNQVPDTWEEEVGRVTAAFRKHMSDIDILLAHDIIFIDTYLPYNLGLRKANIKARQFHFIHSAPSPRPNIEGPHANRYTLPPKSKLVYLNREQVIPLAEMYGVWPQDVRVVENAIDARTLYDQDPLVTKLIEKYGLYQRDIVSVYPVSATRMVDGKQIDVVIKIHEALRAIGHNPLLVVPTAHANGERERAQCQQRANEHVVFTGLEDTRYEQGVTRKVVGDLFRLGNTFILPSVSENCSLILLEAMLAGNLLVLNEDCPGLQSLVERDGALWFKFGNLRMGVRNREIALDNQQYYMDIARIISAEVAQNKMFKVKHQAMRDYNYDAMMRKLEQLYYEQD